MPTSLSHTGRAVGYLPVIHTPPPPPQTGADTAAAELGGAVHVPPSAQDQGPQQALGEAQQDVVLECDPRDVLPRLGVLNALQVRLFEAEVGQWGHLVAPVDGPQHAQGDLIFVDVVLVGMLGSEVDGLLLGGGGGGIEVVARRGMALDVGVLEQGGNLGRGIGVHGWGCAGRRRPSQWLGSGFGDDGGGTSSVCSAGRGRWTGRRCRWWVQCNAVQYRRSLHGLGVCRCCRCYWW